MVFLEFAIRDVATVIGIIVIWVIIVTIGVLFTWNIATTQTIATKTIILGTIAPETTGIKITLKKLKT